MPPSRLLILALAAGLGASACATPAEPADPAPATETAGAPRAPAPTDPTPMPKPPRPAEPAPGELAMECNAQPARWAVGKVADAALVERVRSDTNSERARVLKPGQMVTMEFRVDRVNIDVDANNVVTDVRCG